MVSDIENDTREMSTGKNSIEKRVDVVIVNWNAGALLRECVDSVIRYGQPLVDQIIVVDNGSTDGSESAVEGLPGTHLIRAHENLGFARACNRGANQATAEYLLFLNPDARLLPDTVRTVCDYMDREDAKSVGICGVRLLNEHGDLHRHCARFPSLRTYLGLAFGLTAVLPRHFPPHFMLEFDHQTSREVDQVMGAFFFVRRELFNALRGFDERFFVYFEEVDFSLRAKRQGWSTYYLAQAAAFHKEGGVSEHVKAHRLFYSLRSRILYAFKHFRRMEAWAVAAVTLLIEPFPRLLRAVLRHSPTEARDTLRGYAMLWRDVPNILRSPAHGG